MALLGKVFLPASGAGILCDVALEGTVLAATERGGEGRSFRFPLTESALTFGGADDSQVKICSGDLTFYGERSLFEAPLAELGLGKLRQTLRTERGRARTRQRWAHLALVGFVAFCVLGVFGAFWLSDWVVERAVDLTPASLENSISEPLLKAMASNEVTDPRITGPVQHIMQRLVEAAGPQPYTFRVKVVEDDTPNAFAMPGGGVVVYTGLLKMADSPEEVAGVLAHEVQHVLNRHSLRGLYQQLKWQMALMVLVGNSEGVRELVISQAANLSQLSYGRDMESESDRLGAALLRRAGLSAQGLRDFFVHLSEQEGKSAQPLEFLSTHPATSHRIEVLERLAKESGDTPVRPLEVDWKSLKEALGGASRQ